MNNTIPLSSLNRILLVDKLHESECLWWSNDNCDCSRRGFVECLEYINKELKKINERSI